MFGDHCILFPISNFHSLIIFNLDGKKDVSSGPLLRQRLGGASSAGAVGREVS